MKTLTLAILLIAVIATAGCIGDGDSSESNDNGLVKTVKNIAAAKGFGGADISVTPSDGNKVSGIVTISLEAPADTGVVVFGIQGEGIEDTGAPNLGLDADGSDGWNHILDTTQYQNGVFSIYGVSAVSFEEGQEPTGSASVQVIIEN